MSLRFSAINGGALPFIHGLPENFNGIVIKGAVASYITGSFGYLVLQEYTSGHLSISHVTINWEKPERLICHYQYSPVLFTRVMLKNNTYEVIKGAGDIYMEEEQFSLLTGRDWTSILITENSGVYEFINLAWSIEIINNAWNDFSAFNSTVKHFYHGLPERVTGRISEISDQMKRAAYDLMRMDYSSAANKFSFDEIMLRYLKLILQDLKTPHWLRKSMTAAHWHQMNKVVQMIDEDLNKRMSTPEISLLIGVNENKLKKHFLKATGYNIDEYRRNKVLLRAAKSIIQHPDKTLKSISAEAGYPNVTNFIRAFRKTFYCTPRELRVDTWDLSKLNNHILPESDCDETE